MVKGSCCVMTMIPTRPGQPCDPLGPDHVIRPDSSPPFEPPSHPASAWWPKSSDQTLMSGEASLSNGIKIGEDGRPVTGDEDRRYQPVEEYRGTVARISSTTNGNRLFGVLGDLVQTTAGTWITRPPSRCPNVMLAPCDADLLTMALFRQLLSAASHGSGGTNPIPIMPPVGHAGTHHPVAHYSAHHRRHFPR